MWSNNRQVGIDDNFEAISPKDFAHFFLDFAEGSINFFNLKIFQYLYLLFVTIP